MLSRTVIT